MSNYKAYLRKQPNFDEITGYIYFGQDRIRYPDRSATILRDSPYLGIYDGIGTHELEEQEEQVEKAKLMQAKAREVAKEEEKHINLHHLGQEELTIHLYHQKVEVEDQV